MDLRLEQPVTIIIRVITMPNRTAVVHILSNNSLMIVITITGSTIPAIVVMANGVVILITIRIKQKTKKQFYYFLTTLCLCFHLFGNLLK